MKYFESRIFVRPASFIAALVFSSCLLLAQEQDVTIESRHIVAELVGKKLLITDAILVHAHSPDDEGILTFSVPTGYQDFHIMDGLSPESLTLEDDRIVTSKSLIEEKTPIAFKYTLPVQQNSITLSFQVYRDTQRFYFLMKNLELKISSEQLVDEGVLDMGERKYFALSAVGLRSGENFTITISGLGKRARRKNVLILSSIVAILLIIVAVFFFIKGKPDDKAPADAQTDLLKEKKEVMNSIIAMLDEKYRKGDIGKRTYKELHAEIKGKLDHIVEMEEELKMEDTQD